MHRRPAFDPARLASQPPSEARFVVELARYQDSQKLTDEGFRKTLGISIWLWRKVRSGRLALGYKLLLAGSDFVPVRIYQAAESSIIERMRGRIKGVAA